MNRPKYVMNRPYTIEEREVTKTVSGSPFAKMAAF